VGGHVAPGESPEEAIRREAWEELEIDLGDPTGAGPAERLAPCIYRDEIETEYVVPYWLVYAGSLQPNPEEIEEGAFFEVDEIRRRLKQQPEQFTPHFREVFQHLLPGG